MKDLCTPEHNRLLGALSPDIKKRIYPSLRRVDLALGEVIHEADQHISEIYFPVDCIISLLSITEAGESAEICLVGNEGFMGTAVMMGDDRTSSRAIVQSAGLAYALPASELKREFDQESGLRALILRYMQALTLQMMQTAVCNRHHSISEQLCRWLLLSLDRLPSNELCMTQALIASMLGVRREGVTEAARKLRKLGVIDYHRGRIIVRDRKRLEQMCCECYSVVRRQTDRLYQSENKH